MQIEDYVRSSGDIAYLKQHWDNVKRAYQFTRSHTTQGVYDNSQGTGWVEEWPKMPHQEIYLAALDQQSAASFSRLAGLMGETDAAQEAGKTAADIAAKLAAYRGEDGVYRFSRQQDGSYENVPSIFPAVAWWSGHLALPQADTTFAQWAGHTFSTDWGIRSVPTSATIYDPVSYHHGSVWPLYSGWTSMAEYRTGRPVQAFSNLRNTAELTWLQDAGAITEVVSGEFFAPLGRSSSHQLWSSAMVLAPAIRGLFGLESDALHHTLQVAPQMPAAWDKTTLQHVMVGSDSFEVAIERVGAELQVRATSPGPSTLCLAKPGQTVSKDCTERPSTQHTLRLPLPAVEIGTQEAPASEGNRTSQMKVIDVRSDSHTLTVQLEAPAGSAHRLFVRQNAARQRTLSAEGGTIEGNEVLVKFGDASGTGYVSKTATLRW
jgi:hypothetical protein